MTKNKKDWERNMNLVTRKILLSSGVSLIAVCAVALSTPVLAQASATPAAAEPDNTVVVVTARRKALQTATDRKKNADTMIDSVVADEAGKLPDNSITEVLQRVSGVSIVRFGSLGDPDHFSAEGSGIQVRGLSGVAGFLNGREVFSANGGQGLLWGDVTPELMSAVDVYKDSTADRLVGGTGGAIDLRTKMPFDYKKPAFQVSLSANHGDLVKTTTPEGSFLLTKRWDTPIGEVGALVDLAYSKYSSHDNFIRMEPFYQVQVQGKERYIPGGYDYGADDFNRKRTGEYAAFQWKPNDSLMFYTTLFSSKYESDNTGSGQFVVSQNLTVNPTGHNVFDAGGVLISSDSLTTFNTGDGSISGTTLGTGGNTGISKGDHTTSDWSTGFEWRPNDRTRVSGAVQFVDSSSHTKNYDIFPAVDFPGTFGLDLSGKLPEVTVPSSAAAFFADPKNYHINADMPHIESNHGTMGAANIDADFAVSDTGFIRDIKVGARYASRVERDDISGYNWSAVCVGWNGCDPSRTGGHTFAEAQPGDVELRAYEDFFRNKINLPANLLMPSGSLVAKYDPAYVRSHYGAGGDNPIAFKSTDYSHGATETTEAYVMAKFASDESGWGPFSGNFGLRFVKFVNEASGFITQPSQTVNGHTVGYSFIRNGVTYTTVPSDVANSGGRTTTRALPSFNIAFAPDPTIKVRFAYNTTMDLPSFRDSRANGSFGANTHTDQSTACHNAVPACLPIFDGFTSNVGNPRLKPMFSDNLDFALEWYKSNSFNAHFSVFHKDLKNALIYGQTLKNVNVTYSAPTAQTVSEQVYSNEVFNSDKDAKISGFEVGVRQFFDKLPEPFDGIGYEANYTFIDSKNPGDLALAIDNVQTIDAQNVTHNSHELYNNPVSGLSRDNYNATLMYEKGPWSARLAYSWRSRYLMSTNTNGTNGTYTYYDYVNHTSQGRKISLPLYSAAYGQLDFGGSYRVNDHVSLSLEASNLTDSIAKTLQGGYPDGKLYPRSWFITDKRVNFTVRLNF